MATGSQPGKDTVITEAEAKSRKDAVLVFGATGRLGQEVVAEVCDWQQLGILDVQYLNASFRTRIPCQSAATESMPDHNTHVYMFSNLQMQHRIHELIHFDCPVLLVQLVNSGRNVVASSHKTDKVEQLYQQKGLKGAGELFYENGVDITSKESLMRPELWQGVSQVVTTVGPAFGRQPDGSMG